MNQTIAWRLPLGLCAALLAACDDDEDQRSIPPYDSQLDESDTPVSDLSAAEREQICGSLDGYLNATVGFEQIAYVACLPAALVFGSGTREGCQGWLDGCMAGWPAPIQIRTNLSNANACADGLLGCDLSVAQLEGCINLNLGGVIQVLENLSCADANNEDRRNYARELMQTANACADVNAACRPGEVEVF